MEQLEHVKGKHSFNISAEIWIHVLIAFICLLGYYTLGEFFKFLVAPYIFYMVVSLNPVFIPALLVHFIPGSTASFVILVACVLLGFWNLNKLAKYNLRLLFLVLLLPLPVLLFQSYERISQLGYGLILLLSHWDLYLGFFPLFYGALVAPKLRRVHLRAVFYLLILLFGFDVFKLFQSNLRYTFYIYPLVFGLMSAFYFRRKKLAGGPLKVLVSVVFLGMLTKLPNETFTIILTSLFTFLIVWAYNKRIFRLLAFFKSYAFLGSTLLFVIYAVYNFDKYEVNSTVQKQMGQGGFSISNLNDLKDKLLFKAFADRAPIWKAVLEENVLAGNLWPPLVNESYMVILPNGSQWEADIPAHNIFLELFRGNGILIGFLLSIILIVIFIMLSKVLRFQKLDDFRIAILASVISCAFLGGMTGQYLLLNTFSFLFMSLTGMCIAYPKSLENKYVIKD